MAGLEFVPALSLVGLLLAGWLFLRSTILTQYDASHRRNLVVQLLFAAVFALSANLLQLLVFEILDLMDPRCVARCGVQSAAPGWCCCF
jgi:hypothetical protein